MSNSSRKFPSTECAASTKAVQVTSTATHPEIDLGAAWKKSDQVVLRPEPFGALAYHFDTRRLVFLKSNELVDLVESLVDHDSIHAAINALDSKTTSRRSFEVALASLAESGVIEPRPEEQT